MKMNWNGRLRVAAGAVLLAAPGLVSDRDSTVPLQAAREAGR